MEERRMLMQDKIRQNQMAAERGDTLLDEYERFSEVSQPLDEIIASRNADPKQMKPGQESKLTNAALMNKKFFRQPEVIS